MKFKRITIIGMGLIGGSIGKAALENNVAEEVAGVCRRQVSLDKAIKEKSLTEGFINNYAKAVKGSEIIIIATPVHTIKDILKELAGILDDKNIIVTDAGSTKKEIVDCAADFRDKFSFVGAHPLAGSEKTGVKNSDKDLFKDTLCILTRKEQDDKSNFEKIRIFWETLGARVDTVTPEEHDAILSITSHLPHLVAYALAGVLDKKHRKFTSTGFKDTTRVASSDPVLWSDIFLSNKDNVLEAITRFKDMISGIEDDVRNGRENKLKEKLKACKRMRDEIL